MNSKNYMIRKEATSTQPLLRFMNDEFCEALVNEGKVRLGRMESYKKLNDDPRQDKTEGQANFTDSVGVNYSGSEINGATYILSCSKVVLADEIKFLHKKFKCEGNFFIEIFDPELFLSKIKTTLSESVNLDWLTLKENVYWKDVEYTYGCQTKYDVSDPFFSPDIFQKPSIHQPEKECRLILDGGYKWAEINSDLHKVWSSFFMPDAHKPKYIDLVCDDLSNCVRIKDIRKL